MFRKKDGRYQLVVSLPDKLASKLNDYMQKTGFGQSEVMRSALTEYLDRKERGSE